MGSGFAMLTNPLIYSAIIALCALAREIVRCRYRHRDLTFLLEKTQDPSSLRYLAQLEEARRARPTVRNDAALDRTGIPEMSGVDVNVTGVDTGVEPVFRRARGSRAGGRRESSKLRPRRSASPTAPSCPATRRTSGVSQWRPCPRLCRLSSLIAQGQVFESR